MRTLLLLLCACLVSSCTNVSTSAAVDPHDKVIAVPVGGSRLTVSVKNALRAHGWKVIAAEGVHVTPGGGRSWNGDRGTLARYTMHLTSEHLEGIGPNWVSFDASVVDNKTGEEIVTAASNDTTVSLATGSIMKALGER